MAATRIFSGRHWRIVLTGCVIVGGLPGCRGSRCHCRDQSYESSGYSVEPYYHGVPGHEVPYHPDGSQGRMYEPVPMLGNPDQGHPAPQPAPSGVPMGPEIKSPRQFPGDEDKESLDLNAANHARGPRSLRERISGWFSSQNVSNSSMQRRAAPPARTAERGTLAPRPAPAHHDRVAGHIPDGPSYVPASRQLTVTPTETRHSSSFTHQSPWEGNQNARGAIPVQRASGGEALKEVPVPVQRKDGTERTTHPVDANDPLRALPPWPEGPAGKARTHDCFERIPESTPNHYQPMRVIEPPTLQSPPSLPEPEAGVRQTSGLLIPRIAVCREVRSYDNVDELDRRQLRGGQPVLLYASLKGFQSLSTPSGYRTLTLSTLEIRNEAGQLVSTHPLGTATDLTGAPRANYYLTHQLRLPAELPDGNYQLELTVNDLIGKQTAKTLLAVRVTGR